jgi:hypothetical protein
MKSRFFPKRDEVVLSTIAVLIVVGLCSQGLASLVNGTEHAVFKKNPVVGTRK